MARFTNEQKKISEAMKLLIDLYYRCLESDPKDWFSDKTIQLIAKILDQTIPNFSPSLYFQEYSMFRYRAKDERVRISEIQINDFVTFMNLIHTDISNGIVIFLNLLERVVKMQLKSDIKILSNAEQAESVEHNKIKNMPLCKIIPPLSKDANTETQSKYFDTINMTLNYPPDEYESFRLQVNRDCALDKEFFLENGNTISCPGYIGPEISFTKTVQYLLVKYQFLMKSFERVKICRQCKKLFVEKKLGAKEYCNGTCRKKHHDSLYPREKHLCRGRQNAWIRYRNAEGYLSMVFDVQKDDCLHCIEIRKSGKCPALIEKNKRNFEKFDKAKQKKR